MGFGVLGFIWGLVLQGFHGVWVFRVCMGPVFFGLRGGLWFLGFAGFVCFFRVCMRFVVL